MKTKNINYIAIIGTGLLIALIGLIASQFTNNPDTKFWTQNGLRISEFVGLIMLVRNGIFIRTKYFKVFIFIIGIIIIGAMLKIMHWKHNELIMITGFVGAVLTYLVSFLYKPIKKRLDFLKLLWVFAAYTNSLLTVLNLISNEYQIISSAIMWLAIIDYLKTEKEKGRLFA